MTGGYKIIDLYGLDLANMQLDSTKIEKIFSDIESTYKTKALLFDNYKINGIEQNATFSSAVVKNSGFEITLGDYKLLIKTDSVEDSTLHLYRHDLKIECNIDTPESVIIVTSIYTKNNISITQDNLKEYLGGNGLLALASLNGGSYILTITYYSNENVYRVYTSDDESYSIVTFTNIYDSIIKIF